MKPQLPISNQFPVYQKPKPTKYALFYTPKGGKKEKQIQGDYALCTWKKKQLLQGGGLSKELFTIEPIEWKELT